MFPAPLSGGFPMQTRYCAACGFLNYPSPHNLKPHCFVCLEPLEGEAMPERKDAYLLIQEGGTFHSARAIKTEEELMQDLSFLCDFASREGYELKLRVEGPDTAASCRKGNG
jgi:hypothetical protein